MQEPKLDETPAKLEVPNSTEDDKNSRQKKGFWSGMTQKQKIIAAATGLAVVGTTLALGISSGIPKLDLNPAEYKLEI